MSEKVVILGGGISGLLAAYVFRGFQTTLIERNAEVGGNYLGGGLKYIRHTTNVCNLVKELRLKFEVYIPAGGVLWGSEIRPHPGWLRTLPPGERHTIQQMHWKRTRGSLDGFTPTCMNDPMGEGEAEAVWLDHKALLDALFMGAKSSAVLFATGHSVESVVSSESGGTVHTDNGKFDYDKLITTLPLTVARHAFKASALIPDACYRNMTIARTRRLPDFLLERGGAEFDYIYTPNLSVFHRISRARDGWWEMEAAGAHREPELEHPFMGTVQFDNVNILPGHLLPLSYTPVWPNNVFPLGRFAEWDSRSTAEKSLDRLISWRGM